MNYAAITAELEGLLHELEHNPDLPLDELTQRVQRAYTLISQGREQLHAVEETVTQIIDEFGAEEPEEEDDESADEDLDDEE